MGRVRLVGGVALLGCHLGLSTGAGAGGEPDPAVSRRAPMASMGVDVEVIGASYTTGDAEGATRPIYSLVMGDPRPAEKQAYAWSHRFGMYGLDAILWTRASPGDNGQWRQTHLRRPATAAEIETFAASPGAFKTEMVGAVTVLPPPFRDLDEDRLARIEYIVRYRLGGTRSELKVGVTRAEAQSMASHMRGLLEVERAAGRSGTVLSELPPS